MLNWIELLLKLQNQPKALLHSALEHLQICAATDALTRLSSIVSFWHIALRPTSLTNLILFTFIHIACANINNSFPHEAIECKWTTELFERIRSFGRSYAGSLIVHTGMNCWPTTGYPNRGLASSQCIFGCIVEEDWLIHYTRCSSLIEVVGRTVGIQDSIVEHVLNYDNDSYNRLRLINVFRLCAAVCYCYLSLRHETAPILPLLFEQAAHPFQRLHLSW